MRYLRRILALLFGLCLLITLWHCGRRGSPSGGPKDTEPPVLLRTDPENGSTNFRASRIRLYFDEYIRLQDVQNQLIISPPLKYPPQISPAGGASKLIEIEITDTLLENTTYTLNFGQSVVDNNEGNPYNFLTYVFSTGESLDSLSLTGVVADAFKRSPDPFISVMLYEIDSAYTDSVVYRKPPYYLTNTLDSAVIFTLNNLKEGAYRLIALKDEGKNNVFNPRADKIGFVSDTINLPTDSTYLLSLFREEPSYAVRPATYAAGNRILFGYFGGVAPEVELLTPLPDSVQTLLTQVPGKDSLNYWFTPMEADSLVFLLRHPEEDDLVDTLSVKPLDVESDTLSFSWEPRGELIPGDSVAIVATIPLVAVDTTLFKMVDQDTVAVPIGVQLDTANNKVLVDFEKLPEQVYNLEILPGAMRDFFGTVNDSLNPRWATGSASQYGTLGMELSGNLEFPLIVQVIDARDEVVRQERITQPEPLSFPWLSPQTYRVRIIFDSNGNGIWDPGNFLKKIQPERVLYFPKPIEVRANWDQRETFTIRG